MVTSSFSRIGHRSRIGSTLGFSVLGAKMGWKEEKERLSKLSTEERRKVKYKNGSDLVYVFY